MEGDQQAELDSELKQWKMVTAENEESGEAVIYRIRMERPPLERTFGFTSAIVIKWAYEPASQMPPPGVNEKQQTFEVALEDLSWQNGFAEQMYVSTGMGLKEWVYYTNDTDRFVRDLNSSLAGHEEYPIEIQLYDDPDWKIWMDIRDACRERGV